MVKKCLRANMAMVVHCTHRTDYSTSVAIVCLAGAAAWEGGSTNEGEPKGADCHSLGTQVGYGFRDLPSAQLCFASATE
jgi:hypothetical protein